MKTVLRKYDVAGAVMLCSGQQSEYLNWVAAPHGPSWSCLLWNDEGVRLKAQAKRSHAERFRLQSTVKMIHTMHRLTGDIYLFYDQMARFTEKHLDIEHGDSAHISHDDYLSRGDDEPK